MMSVLFVLVGACASSTSSTDSGPPADDASAEMCTIPDTTCPLDQPLSGAACDTSMTCTYPDPGGFSWTYQCMDQAWAGVSDCDPSMLLGGGCPVGPLAESCRPPFTGTLTDASVEVGDQGVGAFQPLVDGATVDLITGGQGLSMVGFRLRVTGTSLPRCVTATTTLTVDAGAPSPDMRHVALHCGVTLSMFQVVPDTCDGGMHTLDIQAELPGIGSAHVSVRYQSTPCAR